MEIHKGTEYNLKVVPHAGTWIEISSISRSIKITHTSFPTRERGLKYSVYLPLYCAYRSFPTRERGLKSDGVIRCIDLILSFPTRERGLKSECSSGSDLNTMSFPTRERGLKYSTDTSRTVSHRVVPHAGTWIEIKYHQPQQTHHAQSFPTRERGLKFEYQIFQIISVSVVPHAGTWIEIPKCSARLASLAGRSPRGNVD